MEAEVRLRITNPAGTSGIITRCVTEAPVRDRDGNVGAGGGFTNLKRILGRPDDFAAVVRDLAATVPPGHAVVGCDEGAWALTGAVALRLGVPAVLVRRSPKTYFVSYGGDPTIGDGRLAGERLPAGTPVHLIDDLIYSGRTLCSALDALGVVGLASSSASAILWTRRADAAVPDLASRGLTSVTCLNSQAQMPD
jgi:adenine/guanine phosphoribosyltransferase-like PRPP-binding protein